MATSKNTRAGTARKAAKAPPAASAAPKQRPEPAVAPPALGERASDDGVWALRLYIAGDSPKSRTALANLERLIDTHLKGKCRIEVIDLKTQPERAKADQILALPTLIRKIPEPMKRLIGDLSNAERALLALDLGAEPQHKGARSPH